MKKLKFNVQSAISHDIVEKKYKAVAYFKHFVDVNTSSDNFFLHKLNIKLPIIISFTRKLISLNTKDYIDNRLKFLKKFFMKTKSFRNLTKIHLRDSFQAPSFEILLKFFKQITSNRLKLLSLEFQSLDLDITKLLMKIIKAIPRNSFKVVLISETINDLVDEISLTCKPLRRLCNTKILKVDFGSSIRTIGVLRNILSPLRRLRLENFTLPKLDFAHGLAMRSQFEIMRGLKCIKHIDMKISFVDGGDLRMLEHCFNLMNKVESLGVTFSYSVLDNSCLDFFLKLKLSRLRIEFGKGFGSLDQLKLRYRFLQSLDISVVRQERRDWLMELFEDIGVLTELLELKVKVNCSVKDLDSRYRDSVGVSLKKLKNLRKLHFVEPNSNGPAWTEPIFKYSSLSYNELRKFEFVNKSKQQNSFYDLNNLKMFLERQKRLTKISLALENPIVAKNFLKLQSSLSESKNLRSFQICANSILGDVEDKCRVFKNFENWKMLENLKVKFFKAYDFDAKYLAAFLVPLGNLQKLKVFELDWLDQSPEIDEEILNFCEKLLDLSAKVGINIKLAILDMVKSARPILAEKLDKLRIFT